MKLIFRGLNVNVQVWNEQSEETIVLLHGFTGSVATWEKVIKYLPTTLKIVAIDLIGHGKTDAPQESARYTMEEQIKVLENVFKKLKLNTFTLAGYSMGGRVALSYVSAFPNHVKTLILESSSPGLKTESEREARRKSDEELASKIEQYGLESFVNVWENIPLFASQKNLPKDVQVDIRKERLSQREIGLANSLRGMGTGTQNSLWDDLHYIMVPIYLITGELDQKFCLIAEEMKKRIPNVSHILINEVGHAIHVENPEQFATIIKNILS